MKKLLLVLFTIFIPSIVYSQVVSPCTVNGTTAKSFTANLAQNAGTYTLATATNDNVIIKSIAIATGTAATGLTSISMATNNSTADTVLGSTALAALTLDKNLTPVSTPLILETSKAIQYTIVGTGSGGTLIVIVEYYKGSGDLL